MPEFININTGAVHDDSEDGPWDDWNFTKLEELTVPKLAVILSNVVGHVEQLLEKYYREFEYHTNYNTNANLHE